MSGGSDAAPSQGRLQGKAAIITGAASGMGAAMARLFAREGARVLVADIAEEGGAQVVREIGEQGGEAVFVRTDVTREADIIGMIETAVERFGRLDILVNNAGGGVTGSGEGHTSFERLTAEDWDRSHALNLRAPFLAIKYALPHLRRAGGGSIISTGSVAGIRPIRGTDDYNVMKAGLHMLTHTLVQTIGRDNIRINAIAPGWTATPLLLANFPPGAEQHILPIAQPLRRAGQPLDIAQAALFLASDEASSFVTGVVLPVDGGWYCQGDQNAELVLKMAQTEDERPEWS